MDTANWDRVKALFQQALERAPAQRTTFLREACGDHRVLQAEVASLLAAHDRAANVAEGSPFDALSDSAVGSLAHVLQCGDRLGPYEVLVPLGRGGMGEVYRARDTRLDRNVAIKILPADVAADPQRRERFRREARAISSLTHPYICTLHDIGEQGGIDFLVMEYLPGETLANRLLRGALPLEEALRVAVQLADALDAAHHAGLTHRDLKPANVMLTTAGAKVLDFGLAKWPASDPNSMLSASQVTAHPSLTQVGSVVGTLQYMAPEQVEGKPVDARADLFALGAILYEMTTGRKAFEGTTAATVTAAILTSVPPPMATVLPVTPPALDRVVRKCLAKDPAKRWQTAADLRDELAWIEDDRSEQPVAAVGRNIPTAHHRRRALSWAIVALSLTSIAGASVRFFQRPEIDEPARALALLPPEHTSFTSIAVSPDGRQIAFTAMNPSGTNQLWVRPLDSFVARSLSGTDAAAFPFWSPDGRFIAFHADGKLKKIQANGGPAQTICDVASLRGGSWSANGTIIFAPDSSRPLQRTVAAGGNPQPLTRLDESKGETSHRWPFFLPDGHHYLYAVRSGQPAIAGTYVGDLDSTERTRLVPDVSNAAYVPSRSGPGRMLFARGTTLMAQPFDTDKLRLTGEPLAVTDHVGFSQGFSQGTYSVSGNGILAFTSALPGQDTQLLWFDRTGKALGAVATPGSCNHSVLSPDDKSVAYDCVDSQSGGRDIWVNDLRRGVVSRHGPGLFAIWSPDSRRIAFNTHYGGDRDIVEQESHGAQRQETLVRSAGIPDTWSPDGRFLLFRKPRELWVLPFSAGRPEPAFLYERFEHEFPAENPLRDVFAPDSRWIAYEADESGKQEIYVASFAGSDPRARPVARWRVSNNGGQLPRWRRDGTELFYLSETESQVKAVEIRNMGSTLELGSPKSLFAVNLSNVLNHTFNVTGDGQRFLVEVLTAPTNAAAMVITNWPEWLKR